MLQTYSDYTTVLPKHGVALHIDLVDEWCDRSKNLISISSFRSTLLPLDKTNWLIKYVITVKLCWKEINVLSL